jgi:hypothetical protein
VDGNTARSHTGVAEGGGIFVSSSESLTISEINATTASTVNNNSLVSTSSVHGGGIFVSDHGTLNVSNTTVSGNTATSFDNSALGGGINGSSNTHLTLTASTISGNAVVAGDDNEGVGGGIWTEAVLTATNDTIWANSATSVAGTAESGGIMMGGFEETVATVTLINDTIAFNTLTSENLTEGGGIDNEQGGHLSMVNTIVYDPTGPAGSPDINGNLTNAQNNLLGSIAGVTVVNDLGNGAKVGNPLLGPLGDNGGPTETSVPGTGSPAIGGGTGSSTIGTIPDTDQRGEPRPGPPQGFDIGSVQTQVTSTEVSASTCGLSLNKVRCPTPAGSARGKNEGQRIHRDRQFLIRGLKYPSGTATRSAGRHP